MSRRLSLYIFLTFSAIAAFAQNNNDKRDIETAVSYFYFVNCTDFGDYTGWLNDVQAKDFETRGFMKIAEEYHWNLSEIPQPSTKSFDEATIKYNLLENNYKYLDGDYIANCQYTLYIDKIELINNNEALVKITLRYNDNILSSDSDIDVNRVDNKYVKVVKQNDRWLVDDISISTDQMTYFKEFINAIYQHHFE